MSSMRSRRTAISDFSDNLNADRPLHWNRGLVPVSPERAVLLMVLALSAAAN